MRDRTWRLISVVEVIVASIAVILDLFMPTLVILGLMVISFLLRKGSKDIGFKRPHSWPRLTIDILGLMVVWTILLLTLIIPIVSHLTGQSQDLSAFENMKGNVGKLFLFLALTWTLAAFGEEIVYRGYLQTRVREVFRHKAIGLAASISITSVLFGLAHAEQGLVGIIVTTLDAVFFSILRWHYDDNLWAAVLAHGISNTIGLVGFFFLGTVHPFW